jgi:hypothetical protein
MSGRVINTRSKAVEQARGCVARKIGLAGMVKKMPGMYRPNPWICEG